MAIFKCKMCGGSLDIGAESVAVCEYCGTKQTLPKLDDEKRANLYDRANHFRRNNEFDKAMAIYDQILNEDGTDAEAYWSLVLCRYGIEYVEDPASRTRVPTVNRAQFTSIFDDDNYRSALQHADGLQKELYEQEAKAINEIQKGILAISQKEEPFDVFICYKETDNGGRRTPDSVVAQELYYELTNEGFKVFFARITLEDKLGSAYEPYIFAALNSAKVMVALGTKPEHFNAVWVKNEWSRYLALIKNGAKKVLIPAYKDMDPYDLPEEFSHLQAQDMSKLGFMQDLIRGIKKLVGADQPKATAPAAADAAGSSVAALLKRGYMALEDGEWGKADNFFEQTLNANAELVDAYIGKLMVERRVRTVDALDRCPTPLESSGNYQKAIRFADPATAERLKGFNIAIRNRNEKDRKEDIYARAQSEMEASVTAEKLGQKEVALAAMEEAEELMGSIAGWRDASELSAHCADEINRLEKEIEADAKERQRQAEEARRRKEEAAAAERKKEKCKKLVLASVITVVVLAIVATIAYTIYNKTVVIPQQNYDAAMALVEEGKNREAAAALIAMEDYKDCVEQLAKLDESDPTFAVLGTQIFDTVQFGKYEQDGDSDNGKEKIEWLVLTRDDDKALLVSKHILFAEQFDDRKDHGAGWADSDIRSTLNSTFYKAAFSSSQQKKVIQTSISNPINCKYGAPGGKDTKDKVFLLSTDDLNSYFTDGSTRQCTVTEAVKAGGKIFVSEDGYGDWWLRTESTESGYKVNVSTGGGWNAYGSHPGDVKGLRPAVWVDISVVEAE